MNIIEARSGPQGHSGNQVIRLLCQVEILHINRHVVLEIQPPFPKILPLLLITKLLIDYFRIETVRLARDPVSQ